MTAVGLLSYVGLRLLGVPLALILAVVAFLLTFIPFIGPLYPRSRSSWWRSV
jgi:predicted PurR-regulated permease PerM